MPKPDRNRNVARIRFYVDPWSRQHCFTCPLPDCVGINSQACPIYQAKIAHKAARRKSPSPNGRGARGEGSRAPVCAPTPK